MPSPAGGWPIRPGRTRSWSPQTAAAALGLHVGPDRHRGDPRRRRDAGSCRPVITLKVVGIGLLNREVVQDQIARFPTYIVGTPALTRSRSPSDTKPRLSGRAAPWRHDGRGCGRAAVELDRAVLHRFRGHFAAADRGPTGDTPRGARPRRLRNHRRSRRVVPRDPSDRTASGCAGTGPRRHAGGRSRPADDGARRTATASAHPSWSGPSLAVVVALALSALFPIGPVRCRLPRPRRECGLDGARAWDSRFWSSSWCRRTAHRVPRGTASACSGAHRGGLRRSSAVELAARSGHAALSGCGHDLRRRRAFGRASWPLPRRRPRCRHHDDRRDDDADLRREPAHAGVPAGALRLELGLRRAELPTATGRCRTRRWRRSATTTPYRRSRESGSPPCSSTAWRCRPCSRTPVARSPRPIIAGHGLTSSPRDRPRRGHPRAVAQADRRHRRPQVRAGATHAAHPTHDRRRGHHAGHRHRRGAAHVDGDRRRGAGRRRTGDGEPRDRRPTTLPATGRTWSFSASAEAGRAGGPGRRPTAVDSRQPHSRRQQPDVDLRRIRRQCPGRAAPRPDQQLPVHRDHPGAPGRPGLPSLPSSPSAWPSRLQCGGAGATWRSSGSWGSSQRQLARRVAWHASITAALASLIGVPLGVVLGRWLWILFAEEIGAVPAPAVPVWSLLVAAARRPGAGERRRVAARATCRVRTARRSSSNRGVAGRPFAQAIIVGLGGRPCRMSSKRVVMAPSSSGCVRM